MEGLGRGRDSVKCNGKDGYIVGERKIKIKYVEFFKKVVELELKMYVGGGR